MDSIALVGDAFGMGEWGHYHNLNKPQNQYWVTHTGLQHYLEQSGYVVHNYCKGNTSNLRSLKRLLVSDPKDYKYIFFFQTDPINEYMYGDSCDPPYDTNSMSMITSVDQYYAVGRTLINQCYDSYNKLGVKIHCIGSGYKLIDDIQHYSNLVPIVPSFIELLCKNYEHKVWFNNWINYLPENFTDHSFLQTLLPSYDNMAQVTDFIKYFKRDYKHPNKLGHKVLFEKLNSKLLLTNS
jgi:hypothetical protein